jgi:hypothetical protein
MSDYEIEQAQEQAIETHEEKLCEGFARYCKGFYPSIRKFNEIVSTDSSITIIIEKRYCKNNKEQRITIEADEAPITMMDILMHLIQHHKHNPESPSFWEGVTRIKMNKSMERIKLPDGELITEWGS